jgi:pimeloyl-ACP methyl ester carboxylesterase
VRQVLVFAVLAPVFLVAGCRRDDSRGPGAAQPIDLQTCDLPAGLAGRCATYEVYENRTTKSGRKIGLNVVVVQALDPGQAEDPVFWLEGGPGAAASNAVGVVARNYLAGLRSTHDLVFIDTRGTGRSHPLRCDDIGDVPANLDVYFGKLFPPHLVRACRDELEKIADLTQYTTPIVIEDLDEVRAALGYRRINLIGSSYGTLTAQAYMRRYPDHVRSAFLLGVATPDFRLPLPFARATENALNLTFADCAADAACHAAFPNLKSESDAVLARFARGPVQVTLYDQNTRTERAVTLERENYVERLRFMLYSTGGARFVPLVVHRAFLNDFRPFQTVAARYSLGRMTTARGLYFSMTCAETVPFIKEEEIVAETEGTMLGDRRTRAHLAACREWPRGQVPPDHATPAASMVPAVLFSGDADGATPPWIADAAAKYFPNGRLIRASRSGHQIDGPCAWDLMVAFVRNPVASDLDISCVTRFRRPAFEIRMPG